jgi:hypothetical protein
MKFLILDIPPAGSWKRDCELTSFNLYPLSLEILKESDDSKWKISFDGFIAFKVTAEEFTIHLKNVPTDGSFYLAKESVWLEDLRKTDPNILEKCNHYILFLYDEVIEVISKKIIYDKIN